MTQNIFNSGLESAFLAVSSGLPSHLWKLISDLYAETHSNQNLFWKIVKNESGLTIVTFGTTQNDVQPHLICSSDIMDNPFEFICSESNPTFSLNESAFSLFIEHRQRLDQLRSQMDLKKPVIVTGRGVGGSVASLFTLWLLEKMNLADKNPDKRPLCITFGSPLIGDQNLQQSISRSSNWRSCFLHVASLNDPFLSLSIFNDMYRPFGTFLLCSAYGSSCFESPVSIMRLLMRDMNQLNQGMQNHDYGIIVENLTRKTVLRDFDVSNIPLSDGSQACLALQLRALGFPQLLQQSELDLVIELDKQEELLYKMKRFIPNKKLDEMKINMAHLEWYKKTTKNDRKGYYDSYKEKLFARDVHVTNFIKPLNDYWKEMVEEAKKQPQREGAAFRTRWLYAGTNYRRMVEPLDIAQYYEDGNKDYINQERSEHYKQLQKWLEDEKRPKSINRQNVQSILTFDSCFWAHVEEALILSKELKAVGSTVVEKQEAMKSLETFEKYVYGLLKEYAVSPEIFLEQSSYMQWWKEYISSIKGASYDSELANFMKHPSNYENYEKGVYDFP